MQIKQLRGDKKKETYQEKFTGVEKGKGEGVEGDLNKTKNYV